MWCPRWKKRHKINPCQATHAIMSVKIAHMSQPSLIYQTTPKQKLLAAHLYTGSQIPQHVLQQWNIHTQPFYSHNTGKAPAPPVKNWRSLLKTSFTVHRALLKATSAFKLWRCYSSPQPCVLHTHPFNSPLSRTTQVSRYQKGKNQSGFYWRKRQWVAVASAGPYASLHLAPDK